MSSSVAIVVEDELSDRVARRLIRHTQRAWTVGQRYPLKQLPGGRSNPRNIVELRGLSGFGQIKVNLRAFNHAAAARPFLVLTDLDIHVPCPGGLWNAWMPAAPRHSNLIFRVAVKEVEAWLLADRVNMADFLEIPEADVPAAVESLADPKVAIVNLARKSPSADIQHALVPPIGSNAEVGRSYDAKLIQFVRDHWDIDEAAKNCRSLGKAVAALQQFTFTPPP